MRESQGMQRIRRVIVATDCGDKVSDEVAVAARFASICEADLKVLYVLASVEEDYGIGNQLAEDNFVHRAEISLEQAMSEVDPKPQMTVKHGPPFEEICTYANDDDDLLVVNVGGWEKDAGDSSLELGIIAKRLAHKLPHDMVFVRNHPTPDMKNFVVATDFSDCAKDALERAILLAKATGVTKIPAVHAYDLPPDYYHSGHSEEEVLEKIIKYAEQHFSEWLDTIDTQGIEIERVLVRGKPAKSIAKFAEERNAEMLFCGTHGRTASAAVLLGNVAERLIRFAHCSVWAERSDGQALNFGQAIARLMGM